MRTIQRSCFLGSLLADASSGILMPADMNRPYVWEKEHVEALFDSILKQIPIGGFLLWQPNNKADLSTLSRSRLGPIDKATNVQAYAPVCLLLDGQNRLASLLWLAMVNPVFDTAQLSPAEHETWASGSALVFDGATNSVIFVPKNEADEGLRLPAWALMPSVVSQNTTNKLLRSRYDKWEAHHTDQQIEDFVTRFDDAVNVFREARITVTTIEDATAEEARSIFLRICRVGVQMSQEDFDRAIGWKPKNAIENLSDKSQANIKADSANDLPSP